MGIRFPRVVFNEECKEFLSMKCMHEEEHNYCYGLEKYRTLIEMDCCCFFEYDMQYDRLTFSDNMVIPELSNQVIEQSTFQISKLVVDKDVQNVVDFLHYVQEEPIEFQIKSKEKGTIWCQAKGTAVRNTEDEVVAFIGYVLDIDKQKRNEEEASRKSRTDDLTGVWNESALKEIVKHILHTSDLEDCHSMMILSLKDFDLVRIQLGAAFANVIRKNIANNLKAHLSKKSIIGRIGKDTFLIFSSDMESESAVWYQAQKLAHVVEETYSGEIGTLKLSSNIGISLFPKQGTTYLELFKNADKALYQAQKQQLSSILFAQSIQMDEEPPKGQYFYNVYGDIEEDSFEKKGLNMELLYFVTTLLVNSKDVGTTVNIILDRIAHEYTVNNVTVVVKDMDRIEKSYSWNRGNGLGSSSLSYEEIKKLFDYTLKKNQIGAFDIPDEEWFGEKESGNTRLICGLMNENQTRGYVYVDRAKEYGPWLEEDIESFSFLTKIIGFYILKIRSSEKITENLELARNFDALTGLPTIHKFTKDARILLSTFKTTNFAIIYFDIKNFKYLNDLVGYEEGDFLLKSLAEYLYRMSIGKQICARASADNFVTLLPYQTKEQLKQHIESFMNGFCEEQKSENMVMNIGISAGVYMIPSDEKDIMSAIDNANIARKLVKNSSMDWLAFYDERMEQEIRKEQAIISNMYTALEHGEFKVFLQPKIDLSSGKISGAEALVRWIKSDGSMLPPDDFIPLFERNGFIVKLDFCIYEQVCELLKKWRENHMISVPISVNVSRVHLYHTDFLDRILALTKEYEIEPSMLEFELTESIFLNNTVSAITIMKELRKLGFCVSIDDFGAGYSSLNLLKDMRTDVLKLDKEFFRAGDMQDEERIIVSSIIRMAKQLHMKVLSEGVETKIQSDFLKAVDCDMAQGYLYAKPLPVREFEELLESYGTK